MRENVLKKKLSGGHTCVGTDAWEFASPELPAILASAGMDFIWIDQEHGHFTTETVAMLCRASRACEITTLVRVPQGQYHLIARILDMGPDGVIIPRVETTEVAKLAVRASRYPPLGIRGYGPRGIHTDYKQMVPAEYTRFLNDNTIVALQIESVAGVDALDEMLDSSGVDLIIVGPMDLCYSMGLEGRYREPAVTEQIQRVLQITKGHSAPCGIAFGGDMDYLRSWRDRGMTFLSAETDTGLLQMGAISTVAALRQH